MTKSEGQHSIKELLAQLEAARIPEGNKEYNVD